MPATLALFRSTMAQDAWVEGKNLTLDLRFAEGNLERLPDLATELARLPVDVLVTMGSTASVAAKTATNTIPIVTFGSGDPVSLGLAESWAHPGGNVTGAPAAVNDGGANVKQLELLKSILPGLARLAVLINPASAQATLTYPIVESTASALGIDLLRLEVRSTNDFPSAFDQARAMQAQAVNALADGSLISLNAKQLADMALQHAVPTVSSFKAPFADAGFLMTHGADNIALAARAAYYVDRILNGARPADLPVEQPSKFEFVINMSTARVLGITIPPDVATQVTEWVQ